MYVALWLGLVTYEHSVMSLNPAACDLRRVTSKWPPNGRTELYTPQGTEMAFGLFMGPVNRGNNDVAP